MPQIRANDTIMKKSPVTVVLPPVIKKSSKSRSFHFRYMELCRAKNISPVPHLRPNANTNTFLEVFGDKLGVSEWQLIIDALHYDLVLQTVIIRMRRSNKNQMVIPIDSENRARLFRQKPVIYTRFIFKSLVEAIVNCVKLNKNLTVLKLEGLPLQDSYIECIAKALASNDCLKELSFNKSYISDRGACAVCSTVKYLSHVEIFNLGECNLTSEGAEHVANMIKMQKISRFSEGWEKSLRYRNVDIDSISGLRNICLANNPNLGDDGLRLITEVLKEDAWVKCLDLENCGLTDRGANIILECLSMNNAITEINLLNNKGISKFLMRQIHDHLGKEDEEKVMEPQFDISFVNGLQSLPRGQKYTVSRLLTNTKDLEEQLSFERTLRKKAEKLNEMLNNHLLSQESSSPHPPPLPQRIDNIAEGTDPNNLPKGYVIFNGEGLQSVMNNAPSTKKFNQLVNSAVTSTEVTPRSPNATIRNQLELLCQEMQKNDEEDDQEMGAEMNDFHLQQQHQDQQQQVSRQMMQVRKVRSEIKYMENYTKDKKRESKSDHEFANERDFKLNPKVQFELDIGDSVMVNPVQQAEQRKQRYEDGNYKELSKGHKKPQYDAGDYMGGDCDHGDGHNIKEKTTKRMGAMGNSNMTKFMDELERKINRKSVKKRHKSNVQETVTEMEQFNEDSYMANMEDVPPDTESDDDKSDKPIQTYTNAPMKVFVRRTHCEDEIIESEYKTNDRQ